MSKVMTVICRIFLGTVFLGAGINGYLVIFGLDPFIPTSPQAMSLFQFTYLLVVEKSIEIICGLLLLFNQYIPFNLALLAPIVANILLLHLFVDHSLLLLAFLLVITHGYLLYCYRESFSGLLERRVKPFQ